jgi:hypothetical protein
MRLRPVVWLVPFLASGGCSRDTSLPASTPPHLVSVSPSSAYAGQVLTLTGTGFASDASANTVTFPQATARAETATETGITVRLPVDAGSGAVSVTTLGGTSNAIDGFHYLGAGQLAAGRVVSEAPLIHQPRRLMAVRGAVYLDSTLASGVIALDDPGLYVPGGARQGTAVGGGYLYTVDLYNNDPTSNQTVDIVQFDPAHPSTPARLRVGMDAFDSIGYVTGGTYGNRVIAVGPESTSSRALDLWTLDPDLSTPTAGAGPYSIGVCSPSSRPYDFVSPLAVSPGIALFAATPCAATDTRELVLLNLSMLTVTQIADPSHVLDLSSVPLAVGYTSLGWTAAVGLANGRIGIIGNLTGGNPTFAPYEIDTFSSSMVESLFFTTESSSAASFQLLATKREEGIVLGIDVSSLKTTVAPTVTWSVQVNQPTYMTMTGGHLYVASAADNTVTVIDPVAQRQVGSGAAHVTPGSNDGYGGLTFFRRVTGEGIGENLPDAVYMLMQNPHGSLRYGLSTLPPLVADPGYSLLFTATNPYDGVIWEADASGVWPVGGRIENPPDFYPMPATPRRIAFTEGYAVVGHDAGVSVAETGKVAGVVWQGVDLAGGDSNFQISAVGVLSGSVVYAAVRMKEAGIYRDAILTWSLEDLKAGSADLHGIWITDQDGKGGLLASVILEGALWVFWYDAQDSIKASQIEPAGGGSADPNLGTTIADAPLISNATVSPNGRTFVDWEPGFRRDGSDIHLRSTDPNAAFQEMGFLHFNGQISGITFDVSGERLFVATRDPDELFEIQ